MKKVICILLALTLALITPLSVYAEEEQRYPYRTALEQDTYCYKEPDVYSKPAELLKKQELTVLKKGEGGWALVGTYQGELWVQTHNQKFYMNLVFDIYDAPDGEITSEGYVPQVTTVYEVREGWHKIDSVKEAWVKPNLVNDSVIHSGKSWNQYSDNQIYDQKTNNACELYATASAFNSLKKDYVEHPLQLIEKVQKAVNPYEGFNENYGMYAQPLTDFINTTYGEDFFAYNATGVSVDSFNDILARNGRIVVWIAAGGNNYAFVGDVRVLLSSHTVAVVGIDEKYVYITDSSSESEAVPVSRSSFERSFNNYFPDKNQAVVITTKQNQKNIAEYLRNIFVPKGDSES